MKKVALLIAAFALVAGACGGSDAGGCNAIMDDGLELFQDAIDELDGLSLTDLSDGSDPFSSQDFEDRSRDLEQRTTTEGCTNEEMSELFVDRIGELEAGENNPAGQFLVSILKQAAEEGEFDFTG
ncbi:MAG: hypothetical protein HKN74_03685 [Acidimicrobiia bacterium]|nr:hypothetical protein [Acidimicrobiia bacterium]MBT8218040.1 hypothetical protein [Acidimicrobiia bacterium]NNF09366.1 hypothetical protein [Acidimicrobiia bacterium]NNL71195.1 hypothetical protein [Acidimicrobiia bacterium]